MGSPIDGPATIASSASVFSGAAGLHLARHRGDPRAFRPFVHNGKTYIAKQEEDGNGKVSERAVLTNTTGLLRREGWLEIDKAVRAASKQRLRAVDDLRSAGLVVSVPGGMGTLAYLSERESDVNEAAISMTMQAKTQNDTPAYDFVQTPLPVIYKDFSLDARFVAAMERAGTPIGTRGITLATRRCAEAAEKLLLGVTAAFSYGGGTLYGYATHTNKLTGTVTSPTASGWTANTTVNEVIAMIVQAQTALHFGPYRLYASLDWVTYFERDYKNSSSGSSTTLRQRLEAIDGITGVTILDYLPAKTLCLVQMSSETIEWLEAMDFTALQWPTEGGMGLNFRVMAIMAPLLRADINGNIGLVYGVYT